MVVPLFTQPVNAATVGPTWLAGLDKNLLKASIRNPQNDYVNVHNTPSPAARCGASWPDAAAHEPGRRRAPGSGAHLGKTGTSARRRASILLALLASRQASENAEILVLHAPVIQRRRHRFCDAAQPGVRMVEEQPQCHAWRSAWTFTTDVKRRPTRVGGGMTATARR